jgi:SHS family lactate transporter-like MFS transporter
MFLIGSTVTALIVICAIIAPESESWKAHQHRSIGKMIAILFENFGIFAYLLLLMTVMTCLSHGTQDLYPDFLKSVPGISGLKIAGMSAPFGIPVTYNIAAIAGALCFGHLSEAIGRRRAIMMALTLAMLSIPAWAFGASLLPLLLGACLMQTGVQGAFGVIPAHLNELSPNPIRSLFPGVVYQLGVLIGSPAVSLEYKLRNHLGYSWALASFEGCVIIALLFLFGFGPERTGKQF